MRASLFRPITCLESDTTPDRRETVPTDHEFGSDDKASGTKHVVLSAWRGEQSSGSRSWAHGWRLASGLREERLPTTDLFLKKMFDISAKLVDEQDEIFNVDKIHWENDSWKQLSLIGDETVINLQRAKVYVFSDSVLCLGRVHHHPMSNEAWKERIGWIITDQSYRDYDGINGDLPRIHNVAALR